MKKILVVVSLMLISFSTFAQNKVDAKIGFVDFALLRDTLPETDTLEIEIKSATAQFEQQIYGMQNEIMELRKELDSTSDAKFRKYLQKDIQQTEQKMQQTYQQAEYIIGQLQQQAVLQLNETISNAVEKVAKSKKYTTVLDSANVVYGLPQDDLTKEVAKVLNVVL